MLGPVKKSAFVKMWGSIKKWNLEKKWIWGMKYFFWNCICNLKFSAVQHELPVGCWPPSFSQRDLGIKRTRSKRSQIEEWKKNSNLKSYLSHPKGMGKNQYRNLISKLKTLQDWMEETNIRKTQTIAQWCCNKNIEHGNDKLYVLHSCYVAIIRLRLGQLFWLRLQEAKV